jgi:hypothetical protein
MYSYFFNLDQIGGRKVEGIGFLAARQYLDAARPVVQLLVKRTNSVAVSKYTMGGSLEQSFSFSEDLPVNNPSSSDDTDEDQDIEDVKELKVIIIIMGNFYTAHFTNVFIYNHGQWRTLQAVY